MEQLAPFAPMIPGILEKLGVGGQPAVAAQPPAPVAPPAQQQQRIPLRRRPPQAPPTATPVTPQAAPAATPAGRRLEQRRQAVRAQAAKATDINRITSCLATVKNLSTGETPAIQRPQALLFIVDTATPALHAALAAGDIDAVSNIGLQSVMGSPMLQQWIQAEHHQDF